jgi:hypothetical protein
MAQPNFISVTAAISSLVDRPQQRAIERRFVRLPAWMVFYRHGLNKHVSMVRDMNRSRIYFYSNFAPLQGSHIEFVMKFPRWTNLRPIACKGKVLRVEQPVAGAAVGVAVKLSRFWVLPAAMASARPA